MYFLIYGFIFQNYQIGATEMKN